MCAFKETKSIGQVFGLYIFCNNNGVCHYSCNEIINKIQQFTIPPPPSPPVIDLNLDVFEEKWFRKLAVQGTNIQSDCGTKNTENRGKIEFFLKGDKNIVFAAWFGSYCILHVYIGCAPCFWHFLNSIYLCLSKKKREKKALNKKLIKLYKFQYTIKKFKNKSV